MIKKFNISRPKKYFKDNVEKTMWQNVGVITEFHKQDGSVSRIIEIPAIGLEANIFPFEDKKEYPKSSSPAPRKEMTPEEEYNQITPTKEVDEDVVDESQIPY